MKIKGINRNITPDELPEGFVLNNKNVVYSQQLNAVVNENGFLVHQKRNTASNQKYGLIEINLSGIIYILKPIGCKQIDNNALLIWSCGFEKTYVNNASLEVKIAEIGIITKEGEYVSYIRDINNELEFNPNYPIVGEFDYNYKNELITAFTDKNSSPKLVNLTFYKNNPNLFQINDCLMFPNKSDVNCTIQYNNTGGALYSGSYFAVFKYKKKDGSDTNYGITKNPIIIYADNFDTSNITASQGSAPNILTSKSITFNITDVDTTFDYLTLSVIKCINNQFVAEEVVDIPIIGNTLTYLYTGNEKTTALTVAEILTPRAVYSKLGKLTTVSKRLYAMSGEQFDFDYQPYANNIKVKWTSKLKSPFINGLDSPKNQTDRFAEKSFQHREVYSLNIHLILDGGVITRGFHIPGLEPNSGNKLLSTVAQPEGVIGKIFQVEDTCTVNPTTNNPTGESKGLCGQWENDNEKYPNLDAFDIYDVDVNGETSVIGSLKNKNVRHHKMPSIRWMKNNIYSTNLDYGRSVLDCLGLEFTDIKFPKELLPKIKGYVISYNERTGKNNTIIGQSMFVNAAYSQGTSGLSFGSNGVNCTAYQFNNTQSNLCVTDIIRFYDSNLLKNKIAFNNGYLIQELYTQNRPVLFYENKNGSGSINNIQTYGLNFIETTRTNVFSTVGNSEIYREIAFNLYVNSQIIANKSGLEFDNRYLEDTLICKLNRGLPTVTANARFDTGSESLNNKNIQYYLSTLAIINYNPYYNFYAQKPVSTGVINPIIGFVNNSCKTYSGDTYITYNTFNTLGWGASQSTVGTGTYDEFKGIRTFHTFLCESTLPLDLRTITDSDVNQRYFPRYGANLLRDLNNRWNVTCNFWDDSILKINNLTPLILNNPYQENFSKFDFRIFRSSPLSKESLSNNWSIWLTNDYYEANKNKGKLTNIQGADRNLYIQTRQASYYTTGNEQLNTDAVTAFVGVGNIFEREPIEILPSEEGTVGTQNMFSSVLTKYGLLTIDRENGFIWLLNGSEATNISKGLQMWFKQNLDYSLERIEFQEDNPLSLFGFTAAYDWFSDRLIIAKKFYKLTNTAIFLLEQSSNIYPNLRYVNGRFIYATSSIKKEVVLFDNEAFFINKSWTYSYSFITQEWFSEHDYLPDFLVNTRNLLLSFKDNFIYNNNNLNNKAIYYNTTLKDIDSVNPELGQPYISYIIPIFNFNTKDSKIFTALSWLAKVFKKQVYQQQNTFTSILIWNDYQTTGEVGLINFNFDNYFNSNTRNIKDTWMFNHLRDLLREDYLSTETEPFILNYDVNTDLSPIDTNKPFEKRRPLIDKYLAVKLLHDNKINGILQNEIRIEDVSSKGQIVER